MHYEDKQGKFMMDVPDTFVEEVFLEKTLYCNVGDVIRRQWLIDKERYIKEISTTVLDFENFSLHDKTHSTNILDSVCLLLGKERIQLLSIADLWLLLQVAYSHDIGMALTYAEIRDLWTRDPKFKRYFQLSLMGNNVEIKETTEYINEVDKLLLKQERFDSKGNLFQGFDEEWPVKLKKYLTLTVTSYIRKDHAKRTKDKILKWIGSQNGLDIEERLYKIVAQVDYLHCENFSEIFETLKPKETCFGTSSMHPQFVAVLLRMGDLLDMDNNRFDSHILNHFGTLPHTSELHLKKHKALTHLNISVKQITAIAESDDIEVCIEIANWFKWLEQENNDLIKYWNQLVPEEIGACLLSICDLKIYHNNAEFHISSKGTYEVDKQHAIGLLIGDNIYESSLDFLREYVQNAVDASKLEFEKEYKEDKLDYLLIDDFDKYDVILPFVFKKEAFTHFSVKVKVDMSDKEILEISIIDAGVGIEKNGLVSLTTIGRGWKSREQYQDQLKDMLFWLEPTAGFGIGIQAAFMISDEVEFYTKARMESKGHIISLSDPRKSGRVIRQVADNIKDGTLVKIKVPIMRFMESEIYRRKYPEEVLDYIPQTSYIGEDLFAEEEILNSILGGIEDFLRNQIVNSVFPIEIHNNFGAKAIIYSDFWYRRIDGEKKKRFLIREFEEIYIDNVRYYYSIGSDLSSIYVVDDNNKVMTQIDFATKKKGLLKYCYKGIAVVDEYEERRFFNGIVDIWGKDVKKYLKVNRRGFAKEFDKNKFSNRALALALRIYITKLQEKLSEKNVEEDVIFKGNKKENIILSCIKYLLMNDDLVEFLQIAEEWAKDIDITIGGYNLSLREDKFNLTSRKTSDNLYCLLRDVVIENKIILVLDLDKKSSSIDIDMSKAELLETYKDSPDLRGIQQIREILESEKGHFCMADDETSALEILEDIFGESYCLINCCGKNFRVYGIERTSIEYKKETIDFERIAKAGKRTIVQNAQGYEKLHVSSIPFTKEDDHLSKAISYLIMPMNAFLIDKIERAIKKKTDFEIFFLTIMDEKNIENKEWNRLLDWVYSHQCQGEKYTREQLQEEYKQLLYDYYCFRKRLYAQE